MARSNEEIVGEIHCQLGSGHITSIAELLDERVIYVLPGQNAFAGRYQGLGAVSALFTRVGDYCRRHHCTTSDLRIACTGQQVAVGEIKHALVDGRALQWRQNTLYFVSEGHIVECWMLVDDMKPYEAYWTYGSRNQSG